MYSTCLFCLGSLGSNDQIEELPVGTTIAFDAERGRLWIVCPQCRRWNLAPLEERWEAIESAQRRFHDGKRRAQADNIGLCTLTDGTRLVRIGRPPPAEYAAWRFGTLLGTGRTVGLGQKLARRLRRWTAGTFLDPGILDRWRIIHRVNREDAELHIRRNDLNGAVFTTEAQDDALNVRFTRSEVAGGVARVQLAGHDARTLLERILVSVNLEAAPERLLTPAVHFLERIDPRTPLFDGLGEGDPDGGAGVLRMRYEGEGQWRGEWARPGSTRFLPVPRYRTLALEMALGELAERRALEGELRALRLRWQEAETIARIADAL